MAIRPGNGGSMIPTTWFCGEFDARPGGRWRWVVREKEAIGPVQKRVKYDHHGEVLEINPPFLLVYTWFTNFHEPPTQRTVVRWDLTPIAGGTRLTVTHSRKHWRRLDQPRNDYSRGWPGLLDAIRRYVEKS